MDRDEHVLAHGSEPAVPDLDQTAPCSEPDRGCARHEHERARELARPFFGYSPHVNGRSWARSRSTRSGSNTTSASIHMSSAPPAPSASEAIWLGAASTVEYPRYRHTGCPRRSSSRSASSIAPPTGTRMTHSASAAAGGITVPRECRLDYTNHKSGKYGVITRPRVPCAFFGRNFLIVFRLRWQWRGFV
ncbi:unnamed protein product [Gemmata massiliana]|uniref:Uncharacterized protein n=1 Tax=Gemmata massiliana TaxID=1210884 RepID=A0A6P2D6R0_9BACT|nr:unnamed protein product [Gemmata massiliana]